jgi:CheY-like chemotaxis protein
MKRRLPTTVFVVDDDQIVLRRLTKESLRNTNLGVLTADDLPTAVQFVDEDFPIGAILADLNFRSDTQDAKRKIYDGLGFLSYVKKTKPNIPVYVMSMDVDDRASRQQAEEMGLTVRGWYDKLSEQDQFSPWVRIERDLILQALKSEPDFREKATQGGESAVELLTDERVAEKVRTIFNYPRLTYLQYLGKGCGYALRKPIAVHCWPDIDGYSAKAVRIPLLVEAQGGDPVEAIENLGDLIVRERAHLDAENDGNVTGYLRFIRDQLEMYIERDSSNSPVETLPPPTERE